MPLPMQSLPSQVEIIDTEFNEKQELLREIDRQRKIDDPTFRGAFHAKKRKDNSKHNFEDKFKRAKPRQKIKKKK
jgi:ATP-dependent RNA helicase RhlE